MPFTAATGVVPLSVAPPGLLPSAMATGPLKSVATFPKASSARTFTAGVMRLTATEHQLRGGPRDDREVAARRRAQAGGRRPEPVAGARLVGAQIAEARHPVHRRDRRRTAE